MSAALNCWAMLLLGFLPKRNNAIYLLKNSCECDPRQFLYDNSNWEQIKFPSMEILDTQMWGSHNRHYSLLKGIN